MESVGMGTQQLFPSASSVIKYNSPIAILQSLVN